MTIKKFSTMQSSSLRGAKRRSNLFVIAKPIFVLSLIFLFFTACTERRQLKVMEKAGQMLEKSKYTEATKLFRNVIEIDTDSRPAVKAYYRLGFILESYQKDYEGALLSYLEFVSHSGDAVSIYEVLKRIANIYFLYVLDSEKAIETYNKLLILSPDSLEADFFLLRIARSHYRLNEFDKSRKAFQELLEKYPKSQYSARARYFIGNSYFMEGKYNIAIEAFKQIIRHHPNSNYAIEARFLMAQCLEHQGKLATALEQYKTLKGKYPVPKVLNMRIKEVSKRIRAKK